MKESYSLRSAGAVTAAAAILWITSYFTLYSLGSLLGGMGGILGEETAAMLGDIFSALKTAQIRPSAFALFLIGAAYLILLLLFRGKRLTLAISPLFFLSGYGCAVWFASVNGIRFGDVVLSLADMIGRGLFDVI